VPSLAALAAVTALAACGSSETKSPPPDKASQPVTGDERGILGTVDALQSASRKGDGQAICRDLFTAQLVESVRTSAKRSCATEVRQRLFTPDAAIAVDRAIKVTGGQGTAVVREQNGNVSTLSLVKQSGGQWRIDRVIARKPG
jgi:hypothetical protein